MNSVIQPQEIGSPRADQTEREIHNFLLAIDSYPARVAKDPTLTFQQHLCSFFVSSEKDRSRRQ